MKSNSAINVKGKMIIVLTLPDTLDLILVTNLWVGCCYYLPIADEAGEAQRGYIICPTLQSKTNIQMHMLGLLSSDTYQSTFLVPKS